MSFMQVRASVFICDGHPDLIHLSLVLPFYRERPSTLSEMLKCLRVLCQIYTALWLSYISTYSAG